MRNRLVEVKSAPPAIDKTLLRIDPDQVGRASGGRARRRVCVAESTRGATAQGDPYSGPRAGQPVPPDTASSRPGNHTASRPVNVERVDEILPCAGFGAC